MRNLLGRLNARSPEDLRRIAGFWRVPYADGPKHRIVGALYRTMTDPRAGRDVWERLADAERAVISHLALTSETALTVGELAGRLRIPEAEAHEVATRLYRAGMVAREGDDDPLPIGERPRLSLPLEIWQLARRIRDEHDVGDLSGRPLGTLLELLDDTELEEAARHWGLRVIPGLRQRSDLIGQILGLVGDAGRLDAVVRGATRRREAAKLWDVVRTHGRSEVAADAPGTPIPFAEALAAAGLDEESVGDDAGAALRTRATLGELEERLLVWHTYDGDGDRFLFVPTEIVRPAATGARPAMPEPVPDGEVGDPPWRSPAALAWDLLTVLRAIGAADAPRGPDVERFPKPWRRRIAERLWAGDDEAPPRGYLGFLVALARDEGLVQVVEDEGSGGFVVAPAIRAWRDRGFPEQMSQLRLRWLASPAWVEGASRDDLAVEGADWRGFRRKLLAHLTALTDGDAAGRWFPLEGLASWLAAQDPDLLGETFSAASAGFAGATASERRRSAIAHAIMTTAETALRWFGILDLAIGPGATPVVRIDAAALTREVKTPERDRAKRSAPLAVGIDGTVSLHVPSPVRVWSLLAFADQVALGEASTYRLTEASIGRALAAGFDLAQIIGFLDRQTAGGVPDAVANDLASWAKGFRRVRARRVIVLRPDDPAMVADLERTVSAAGWACHRLGDAELAVELPDEAESFLKSAAAVGLGPLFDSLRSAGFHPA